MAVYSLEIPAKRRKELATRWGVTGQTVYLWLYDKPVAGKRRMLDLALSGMTVAPKRDVMDLRAECTARGMYLQDFYDIMAAGAQTRVKATDPRRVSLLWDVFAGLDKESGR